MAKADLYVYLFMNIKFCYIVVLNNYTIVS